MIRPLIYCAEDDLAAFADEREFPILPCDLCGSQENLQRKPMKRLLAEMDGAHPGTRRTCSRRSATCARATSSTKACGSASASRSPWSTRGPGAFADDAGDIIPVERLLRGLA